MLNWNLQSWAVNKDCRFEVMAYQREIKAINNKKVFVVGAVLQ